MKTLSRVELRAFAAAYTVWEHEEVEAQRLAGVACPVVDMHAAPVPARHQREVLAFLNPERKRRWRERVYELRRNADRIVAGLAKMLDDKDKPEAADRQRERADGLRAEAAKIEAELDEEDRT